MTKTIKLIITGLLLFSTISFAQKSNRFIIDTAKILSNQNLDGFIQSLKKDTFQISPDKNAIPKHIKKQLDKLAKGFSIGNPNQDWQCCCTSSERLPERQMNFLARSKDVLVLTYKTGGFGVSTHLLLIRFDKDKILDLWSGYCWADVSKVSDIVSYIDEARKNNQELNTNMIIL
ncbi:MAG: hypothetical protein QM791_06635 [Ferruginibacter sp.]